MSSYFIAQIRINDPEEYKKYLQGVDEVFYKFNGKYLTVDSEPEVIEGNWNYNRVVVIEFPNKDDLKKWYDSEEYQNILKYRLNAAVCDTVIAKGII
jgi:uncharacterized protein (DUF1330 family)